MGRCRLIIVPTNRQQKKKAMKEAETIEDTLFALELDFYNKLFDDNDTRTYQELYSDYLDVYTKRVNYLERHLRPVFFTINKDYFSWCLKPRVKPRTRFKWWSFQEKGSN